MTHPQENYFKIMLSYAIELYFKVNTETWLNVGKRKKKQNLTIRAKEKNGKVRVYV